MAWLWLFIVTAVAATPPLVLGFVRRGTGVRDPSFLIQRAPQIAMGLVLSLAMVSFEAIEFAIGNGEPAFGKSLFEKHQGLLPIASLALVLPTSVGAVVSWLGVAWAALGSTLLVSGMYTLRESFSTDSEILPDQSLYQGGPYRFLLHPIYAGWVHFLFGTATTTLSPIVAALAFTVVVPLFIHRAKHEEEQLLATFGAKFVEFATSRHWRRLIPLLRPVGK